MKIAMNFLIHPQTFCNHVDNIFVDIYDKEIHSRNIIGKVTNKSPKFCYYQKHER